jgi:hypothetical protein
MSGSSTIALCRRARQCDFVNKLQHYLAASGVYGAGPFDGYRGLMVASRSRGVEAARLGKRKEKHMGIVPNEDASDSNVASNIWKMAVYFNASTNDLYHTHFNMQPTSDIRIFYLRSGLSCVCAL